MAGFGMPPNPNNYQQMSQNASDQDYVKNDALYGFDNPETAFDSVLRDRGINPYVANPFVQTMRSRAARPLAQSYLMSRAGGQSPWGGAEGMAGAQGKTLAGVQPFDYADYINRALGSDTSGIYASIRNQAGAVPTMIQQLRDYQKAQMASPAGGTVPAVNPFMEALGQQFGADNGQGAAQAQAALYAPLMASPLAGAYRTGVNQASSNALYNMMNTPGVGLNDDLWKWLYGI